MIITTLQTLDEESIPVFITEDDRHIAQGFANQQSNPTKADQVYRNTLAVSVMRNYLRVLGIPTTLSHCDSWNPMMRMGMNTADLEIVGQGRIECRPLSTEELQSSSPTCYVPTEVHDDRIGYIVVHLEEEEATLLGFTTTVTTEQLPLAELQPFSNLLPHLHTMGQDTDRAADIGGTLIQLSQWFQDAVESGWETLDSLFRDPTLAVQYRQVRNTRQLGKVLTSESSIDYPHEDPVLVVKITQPAEPVADNAPMDIQVKVQPSTGAADLPPGLEVRLSDETGATLLEAVNTEERRVMQLEFDAETGDRFDIHIQWGNTMLTERFMV